MKTILFLFMIFSTSAFAADKMIVLNDQEQAAYMAVLDAALKSQGLQAADMIIHLRNKLTGAMVVIKKEDLPTVPAPLPAPPVEPKP